MGHETHYMHFDYNTKREIIQSEGDKHCKYNSDYRGTLYNRIIFKDITPLATEEEAIKYIARIDSGDYGQYAVPYLDYPYIKPSSDKLKELEKKATDLNREYYNRCNVQYYTTETVKSQFLGCKECGSRLAVKYLRSNNCPLCGAELRPETELNKIKALKEKYDKAHNAYVSTREAEEEKMRKKMTPTKKWLVKIEYHV